MCIHVYYKLYKIYYNLRGPETRERSTPAAAADLSVRTFPAQTPNPKPWNSTACILGSNMRLSLIMSLMIRSSDKCCFLWNVE